MSNTVTSNPFGNAFSPQGAASGGSQFRTMEAPPAQPAGLGVPGAGGMSSMMQVATPIMMFASMATTPLMMGMIGFTFIKSFFGNRPKPVVPAGGPAVPAPPVTSGPNAWRAGMGEAWKVNIARGAGLAAVLGGGLLAYHGFNGNVSDSQAGNVAATAIGGAFAAGGAVASVMGLHPAIIPAAVIGGAVGLIAGLFGANSRAASEKQNEDASKAVPALKAEFDRLAPRVNARLSPNEYFIPPVNYESSSPTEQLNYLNRVVPVMRARDAAATAAPTGPSATAPTTAPSATSPTVTNPAHASIQPYLTNFGDVLGGRPSMNFGNLAAPPSFTPGAGHSFGNFGTGFGSGSHFGSGFDFGNFGSGFGSGLRLNPGFGFNPGF